MIIKLPDEKPSIGIMICKEDSSQPIGIATYKLLENLPNDLKGYLPTVSEIEEKMLKLFEEQGSRDV